MKMTRRNFVQIGSLASLFAAGGCSVFNIAKREPRRPAANERLTLGVIGCGVMGSGNMGSFLADERVQVVAVCDPVADCARYGYHPVNKTHMGRLPFKQKVDAKYGTTACRAVMDWREVVNDPTIDAVLISTPDHWHAIIAIAAMKAGKHVYCQKPLTMSIAEGRRMCEVAAETGVTFQVGSQQRSASEFRVACELFRNGYLGECKEAVIGLSYPHNDSRRNGYPRDDKPGPLPDWFKLTPEEWAMWQGPGQHWPDNAFILGIHGPMVWRWSDRTGNGALPDWGAHHIDILQWALGKDTSGPIALENFTCDIAETSTPVFSWFNKFKFDIVYDNGFRAHVMDSDQAGMCGIRFLSKSGNLFVGRGKLDRPAHLRKWNEKKDLKDSEVHLYKSRASHEWDFVDAIYEGRQPCCPCEVGHRSITVSHLANSCAKTGVSSLKWDPVKETSDNAAINARADIVRHNGWKLEV